MQISSVRSIEHKASGIDELRLRVNGGQAVFRRQVHEPSALPDEYGAWQHRESTRMRLGHLREGPVEIGGTACLNELKAHSQRPRRLVRSREHVLFGAFTESPRRPEDRDPVDPRDGLVEQLQTLADQIRNEGGQPREIAARPRKAADEPAGHGIDRNEDNGNGAGRLLGGAGHRCAADYDDINLERNQFCGEGGEPLVLSLGISVFNDDIATHDVPEVLESLEKGLADLGNGRDAPKVAYASELGRLLRLGGERRKQNRAHARKERAAIHHSMTSSARPSSEGGIVRPRALAVLRLMISSNLVGCSTGSSAGLAPLRILPT